MWEAYAMLKYTQDHEWLRLDGEGDATIATIGITQFAQKQLGDLVFVELPSVGASFDKGAVAATVESVKAASEVYAPIGGEVVEVNDRLTAEPGLVNAEPNGEGWLFKIKVRNAAEAEGLLDEGAYQALTAAEESH
jgi:glycine cleavage system H protein